MYEKGVVQGRAKKEDKQDTGRKRDRLQTILADSDTGGGGEGVHRTFPPICTVQYYHRRRIKTEEKAKGIAFSSVFILLL